MSLKFKESPTHHGVGALTSTSGPDKLREWFVTYGHQGCEAVEQYVAQCVTDIKYLEGRAFHIRGKDTKFELSELPNDMTRKCCAFKGGGGPSNGAKFFSSLQMCLMAICLHCSSHLVSQRTRSRDHGSIKDDKQLC